MTLKELRLTNGPTPERRDSSDDHQGGLFSQTAELLLVTIPGVGYVVGKEKLQANWQNRSPKFFSMFESCLQLLCPFLRSTAPQEFTGFAWQHTGNNRNCVSCTEETDEQLLMSYLYFAECTNEP